MPAVLKRFALLICAATTTYSVIAQTIPSRIYNQLFYDEAPYPQRTYEFKRRHGFDVINYRACGYAPTAPRLFDTIHFLDSPLPQVIINRVDDHLILSQESSRMVSDVTIHNFFHCYPQADMQQVHKIRYVEGKQGQILDLNRIYLPKIRFSDQFLHYHAGYNDTFYNMHGGVLIRDHGYGYNFFIFENIDSSHAIIPVYEAKPHRMTDVIYIKDRTFALYNIAMKRVKNHLLLYDLGQEGSILLKYWFKRDHPSVRFIQHVSKQFIDLYQLEFSTIPHKDSEHPVILYQTGTETIVLTHELP
ncbi:MAG: hypothetical protein ISP86_02745 [Shewanellaceae bacterium]|nr:hypothetical protein [Shewanellaceae bacterium]